MSVITKIQENYDKLSASQKRIADYIFMNEEKAAMQTSTEISMDVGVSGSTVIRLAYSLGYKSFSEMQDQLKSDALRKMAAPVTKESSNNLQAIIDEEIAILTEMRDSLIDYAQIRRIAERLMKADRIMILGYFGEHTASFQLYLLLDSIRPDVYYFRQNNAGYREAMQLTENSVVIASAFPPYAPGTLRVLKEMKASNPYTIAFSDSPISDIAREADENVILKIGKDLLPGIVRTNPLTILFTAIFDEMILQNPEVTHERFNKVPSQLIHPYYYNVGNLGGHL